MSTTLRSRLRFSLALLAALACFGSSASAEFTNADLNGRKAFRSTIESAGTWSATATEISGAPYARLDRAYLQVRGALTFDGRGGLTGFRLVWGTTSPSPATLSPEPPYTQDEDHRTTPLRQQISGRYSVSPDGVVEMTYVVTPAHIFSRASFDQVGTTTVSSTEVATAILSDGGRLDGQFSQSLSHVYPEEYPDHSDLDATYAYRFETLDGCSDGPPTPRALLGAHELRPPR